MNDEKHPDDETEERPEDESETAETREVLAEPEDRAGPRRVLRSSDDRVLAGVAGGLGAYFGVDSLIFRIGFALSIFFGGLGILAYLLLAIFVPRDNDPEGAEGLGARFRGGGFLRGVGLVVCVPARHRPPLRPRRRRRVRGSAWLGCADRDGRDRDRRLCSSSPRSVAAPGG